MLHLKDVHNGEELSCMALDGLGQRLLTGARDGSAFVSILVSVGSRYLIT